jgi:hypothetical protein
MSPFGTSRQLATCSNTSGVGGEADIPRESSIRRDRPKAVIGEPRSSSPTQPRGRPSPVTSAAEAGVACERNRLRAALDLELAENH